MGRAHRDRLKRKGDLPARSCLIHETRERSQEEEERRREEGGERWKGEREREREKKSFDCEAGWYNKQL